MFKPDEILEYTPKFKKKLRSLPMPYSEEAVNIKFQFKRIKQSWGPHPEQMAEMVEMGTTRIVMVSLGNIQPASGIEQLEYLFS